MRQLPLPRLLMARRTITETDDAKRTIKPRLLRSLGAQKRARERLDQDRIGNEQPHDKASCFPPFLALPGSNGDNSLLRQ